jgi:glycerol transport system ATP-binding protein
VLEGGISIPVPRSSLPLPNGEYVIGFRAHHLSLDAAGEGAVPVRAKVVVTEITGSESFVHVDFADVRWVALVHGVRELKPDDAITLYLTPERFFVFTPDGQLASAPDARQAA